jgi:pimeloyl-ACP methyl ester carboxylesterase
MIGEFLDELGVKKPVLVGHSLGGAVSPWQWRWTASLTRSVALALLCPLTQIMENLTRSSRSFD